MTITQEQKVALASVKNGIVVPEQLLNQLKTKGLVEQVLVGHKLTIKGAITISKE